MLGIKNNPNLTLQIIATGTHLSPFFGHTCNEIESDGFEIDRKIECYSESDDPVSMAQAASKAMSGCANSLQELKPDIVLVLGDRIEIFAACVASLLAKIPIAHLHGGEVTIGAYDDALRHSITKMSSIHFVATEVYKKRVMQLGEDMDHVYLVGGLGVDAIKNIKILSKKEIEKRLKLKFSTKNLLITFHPATLDNVSPSLQIKEILKSLSNRPEMTLIFTMPNADIGGFEIIKLVKKFVENNSNAYLFDSLGQSLYLSCMANVDGVVGNSSSGILEAPTFKVGTINIGNRQKGRMQADSIINVEPSEKQINKAIDKLYSREFKSKLSYCKNPYGDGGASEKIVRQLKKINLDQILQKKFVDIPFTLEKISNND